ncbi:MAG: hypothetical protein IKT32_04805 [Clostridia bacterium]|nr:hypothetical protein [Clostridia bacterium]
MIETEEHLLQRNRVAASLGQDLVLDILKQYREQFVSQMKTIVPTNSDVYGINLHRALGRVEAIDYLISEGERAIKPQSNKKDK